METTTYTIIWNANRANEEYFPHGVWYRKASGSDGYNRDAYGNSIEAVIADQIRCMRVYGWVGTVRVIDSETRQEIARVEVA